MMFKILYNELAKESFPDSEMLYIADEDINHAYNVLIYGGKNKIRYIFIDITEYILKDNQDLEITNKKFLRKDHRIRLSKNGDNKNENNA